MLYDLHTGEPVTITSPTPAFFAVAEPYSVTIKQARAMLGGADVRSQSAAQIVDAARKHADTDVATRGPAGRVFVRVGGSFHAVAVGSENPAYPVRYSTQNPDWSAMRAKASHYGSRAATGAREAYAWTAPRAKRAAEVTWEGAKSAGRAVKRGAKRAAPVVARGARSAAEGLDRWSQTNGRHNSGEPWGYYNGIQLNVYSSGGRRTEVYVSVYARGLAKRTPVEIVEAIHRAMGGNPEGNRISWDRSIDMKRLGRVVEKAAK